MQKYILALALVLVVALSCSATPAQKQALPDLSVEPLVKTHSETVSRADTTYTVAVSGETPVENELVRIEAVGGVSKNPSLTSERAIDFSSLASIVKGVVTPSMTDEQKALALWRFVIANAYDAPWGTSFDGLEHLNVYGYGYCGTFASMLESLWWAAGLKGRHVNIGNHAATEVFYDNDWHYIDAHWRCFFLKRDNKTIANLQDLNIDPSLRDMKRQKKSVKKGEQKYYYMTMHPTGQGSSPPYTRDFTMAKGDALTLTWEKSGKWSLARGAEGGDKPAPEPPVYANGTFRFFRDMSDRQVRRVGLVDSSNIDWEDAAGGYVHPRLPGQEAFAIYRVRVPYFIPSVSVSGAFYRKTQSDLVTVDISTDDGKSWKELLTAKAPGMSNAHFETAQTQEITTDKTWKYSYLLRVRMRAGQASGDAGCYRIESITDLVYNPKSLPGLQKGENRFRFVSEGEPSGSVRITHQWRESLPLTLSNESPIDGEEVFLAARVRNKGDAVARQVAVVFYYGDPSAGGSEIGSQVIEQIKPGQSAVARIKWRATTRGLKKSDGITGAPVFVTVNPKGTITESDRKNNTFRRIVKVLNPPDVSVPSESFVRLEQKNDVSNMLTITATVRNFSGSSNYGYYIDDHAEARRIVVRFFDGDTKNGRQIGTEQTIGRLLPLEYKNVSVDWDITHLKGKHTVQVLVLPPDNLVHALGSRGQKPMAVTVDLDAYRNCSEAAVGKRGK
jgi:hypothetical protein